MLNALTIDVEDYFQVAALSGSVPRATWVEREYRAERNTDRLLEVFDAHGVRATFFVLGWIAERSPTLVRRIAAAGHEIASHGYGHQCIFDQDPQAFREETKKAKVLLEDLVGAEVLGYRAASFSVTRRTLWALDTLIDLGFRYDSSIFPIRHDLYGIPDAKAAPGDVATPSGRTIVEFPLSTAHWVGRRVPVSGGGYFRILPYWLTRAGLRQINHERRPFAFYLHPWEIDPGQPRIRAKAFSRFRHYTNLEVCEARLERLLREFRFAPMADVLADLGLIDRPVRTALPPFVAPVEVEAYAQRLA